MTALLPLAYSTLLGLASATPDNPSEGPRASTTRGSPSPEKASGSDSKGALSVRVQRFYDGLRDFEARFVQTYTRTALSRTSEQSGTLIVKKGGKVHWTYQNPVQKLYVSDGKTLWMYEPEEQQVIVDRGFSTQQLGASLAFLWGDGQLKESFDISVPKPGEHDFAPDASVLQLVPKTDQTYQRLILRIDPKTGRVDETILYETSGNTNRFEFVEPRINQGVADSKFQFIPPDGVEVINRPS